MSIINVFKTKQSTKKKSKGKMNNSKNSKKKKQDNEDPKIQRDIRIPVEPLIPQCEVCEEKKADFYCSIDKVHYCKNCESDVHTPFLKKKHKESIFKEPYIQQKEIISDLCDKHQEKLSLYCQDENELICTGCYETCRKNNHSILGLNEYTNEISVKIRIILNKIQKEEMENNKTIKHTLENKNKLRHEIKEIANYIENGSSLLIKKIKNSKINYLNLLNKVEKLSNTTFDKILSKKEENKKNINKNKTKINNLKKIEKDKKKIKLIQESKEIIEKIEKAEREREEREKEKFDPKMNQKNRIKLKNGNKTAWNPSSSMQYSKVCGKKIYSIGKHEIKIKIDQFPNLKNEWNRINLGVIKTENRKNFIKHVDWDGTYYFTTDWDKKIESQKCKIENGKRIKKKYPAKINLKKNDILSISLDMDQKKISFKINEKNIGGWENLPGKVNFFAVLRRQIGKEKNQITII
ncbi:tripartite motif-containing protein [Anaeramoeba flamelloides]|uniref:Tripartite motif-containing protein n=1 Tax=Anaeramoeba flamelloides TaxID=1746091 RepID=A0ABQ8Y5B5_9EUKA|nr:tripartite motif-containing protein [Anaeramoeba flamelloides]